MLVGLRERDGVSRANRGFSMLVKQSLLLLYYSNVTGPTDAFQYAEMQPKCDMVLQIGKAFGKRFGRTYILAVFQSSGQPKGFPNAFQVAPKSSRILVTATPITGKLV